MKLTVIFLLPACLTASANGFGQTISLSETNASLTSVFQKIEKQSGYTFYYKVELLQSAKPVNISVKDVSLEKVLQILFKDQPLAYNIVAKNIVVKEKTAKISTIENLQLPPPPIDVKGRVVNEKGEGIVATVSVKGTTIAVSTDANGYFTLTGVDENAILVITGVSIETTELKTGGRNNLVVNVKTKIIQQKEVTVTAFGIEKSSKEIGYSVTKVTGEQINRTAPSNLLTSLAGRVTGLNISTQSADMNPKMQVLLRGIRSITANSSNQPLFVVNGSPLSFGSGEYAANMVMDFINNINPNDIESVTVIKGANGAALYGPEGVNGVIIITTKKGSKGKPQISLINSTSFTKIDYRHYSLIQKKFGSGGSSFDALGNPLYDPYGASGFWGPAYNGQDVQIGRPDENGDVQTVPYQYTNDRRKFYQTAVNNQTNLSFAQSDSKSEFYLNLGYSKQNSTIPGDYYQNRARLSLNTIRHFGKASIRVNIAYTNTKSDNGPQSITTEYIPFHVPITRYKNYLTDQWSDRNHYWSDLDENPYELMKRIRTNVSQNALLSNFELTIKPLSWLTITERPGINYSGFFSKQKFGPRYYSDFAKNSGRPISSQDRQASVSETMTSDYSINNDLLISGLNRFEDFSLRTLIGNNIRENHYKELGVSSGNLAIPVYNIRYAEREVAASEKDVLSRSYSFFGSTTIGYKDRIFVEITGRDDWDSKLAVAARGNNYYYGINSSAVMNEIFPALSAIKWLSGSRLRASITRTANMNIEPYQSQRLFALNPAFPFGPLVSFDPYGGYPNPDLKPEKIISQEYGGSFSFLKNRVVLDVTYYSQINNGMILGRRNSIYSTAPSTVNAGKFRNYGWEFELKLDPVFKFKNGFSCSVNGGLSMNDNKVLSLNGDSIFVAGGGDNLAIVARPGHHAFEFGVFDWQRDPDGHVIVDRTTGMPSVDKSNLQYKGRVFPKYTANFNLNFTYKKIQLNILGEYRGGHQLYDNNSLDAVASGLHPITTQNNRERFVFPNSVFSDGNGHYSTNNDVLVQSAGQALYLKYIEVSKLFLTSAAYLKIREISFSYDKDVNTKWAQKINIGVYCRNPFAFYPNGNRLGDPELVSSGFQFDRARIENPNGALAGVGNGQNLDGATNSANRRPGIITFGLTASLTFK